MSRTDILGRWKPEGSDTYVRSYGGRVARLQSRYAAAAREDSRYSALDEREIAANLLDWLQDRRKLGEEASKAIVDPLVHMWKTGRIFADLIPVIPEVEDNLPHEKGEDSEDSQGPEPASSSKVAKTVDRTARYVIVELPGAIFRLHRAGANGCWMGRKREFKSSRDFSDMPDRTEYTHVCRLCWPDGQFGSDDNPTNASPAGLETNLRSRICRETQNGLRRSPSLGAGRATMIAGSRSAPDRDGTKRGDKSSA